MAESRGTGSCCPWEGGSRSDLSTPQLLRPQPREHGGWSRPPPECLGVAGPCPFVMGCRAVRGEGL